MNKLLGMVCFVFSSLVHAECTFEFGLPGDVTYQENRITNFVVEKIRPFLQDSSSLIEIDIQQTCDNSPAKLLRLKMDRKSYYILSIQEHDLSKEEYTYQTSSLPLSLKELRAQISKAIEFETLDLRAKQDALKELAFFFAESARFSNVEQIVATLIDNSSCSQDWLQYAHIVRRWARLSDFSRATKLDSGTIHGGSNGHLIAPISNEAIAKYNEIVRHGKGDPQASLVDDRDWNNPIDIPAPVCSLSNIIEESKKTTAMSAYFVFEQTDADGKPQSFVFEINDPKIISEARSILADSKGLNKHVQGKIIPSPAQYNPGWSFHLAPQSIGFFEMQIEVCDANMSYVEKHLDEIGGSTLPGNFWCPWSSRLKSEIKSSL